MTLVLAELFVAVLSFYSPLYKVRGGEVPPLLFLVAKTGAGVNAGSPYSPPNWFASVKKSPLLQEQICSIDTIDNKTTATSFKFRRY